jgi:hypothetical protein
VSGFTVDGIAYTPPAVACRRRPMFQVLEQVRGLPGLPNQQTSASSWRWSPDTSAFCERCWIASALTRSCACPRPGGDRGQ